MKEKENKEKFIELRAQGYSFEKISRQIRISKPTLIKWQSDLNKEISELEDLNYQNIIDEHKLSKSFRIKKLSAMLEKVLKEMERRDLTKVGIKDLIRLKIIFESDLNLETINERTPTGESEIPYTFPLPKKIIEVFQDNI